VATGSRVNNSRKIARNVVRVATADERKCERKLQRHLRLANEFSGLPVLAEDRDVLARRDRTQVLTDTQTGRVALMSDESNKSVTGGSVDANRRRTGTDQEPRQLQDSLDCYGLRSSTALPLFKSTGTEMWSCIANQWPLVLR